MQVCTYLDRRFVTSLLSRPNCFSRKASTICYAQPVKENKSLEVLVLPSPPQWAFEGCCWSGNRGKITGSASASILSPSSSTHALRHFLLVLTEPRFAKYTYIPSEKLQFSILLCLCFVFLTRARAHTESYFDFECLLRMSGRSGGLFVWTKYVAKKIFRFWSKMMIFKLCADNNSSDCSHSTRLLAATTLRNVLGTKNLAEILSERETISHVMQNSLDDATDPWGVKVERVEM